MTNLPENWIKCTLGDIIRIRNGYAFPKNVFINKENAGETAVPLIKQTQLSGYTIDLSDCVYVDSKYLREKEEFIISYGDILIGLSGSIMKWCIYDKPFPALQNQRTGCIKKSNKDKNIKYILFYLRHISNDIIEQSKGIGILNISTSTIEKNTFPLPPLAEQGRIVAKIEELFAGIDAGVENLKSVKNQIALYRQSVLKSAFDGTLYKTTEWNFTSIGTVCDINPKTVLPDFSDDSIVSFLPMPTVEAETGAFSPETVEYKKVKKGYTKFQNNDVLFAKITPCMENGKSCVVHDLIQGVGFGSTEFHVLRCHAGMLPEYVFYFVVQKVFRSKAIPFMTGAVGQKRVPADYLRDCEIPVPSLDEQKRIVAEIESRFERADALETAVDRALSNAEKLKQAVLKKAFSGELVPQNPDDEPASVLLDRIRAARASELPAKKGKRK